MSEESSHNGVKAGLGIVGAVLAIASIFWFALRPRLFKKDQA
jgi:hypothetical protein